MANLLSFDENNTQFAWDSSSLNNAARCLRYYYYKNIEGFELPHRSVHLVFGGHYAKGLERFYKYLSQGLDRTQATVEMVRQCLIDTWEYDKNPVTGEIIPGTGGPWISDHNTKTRETLIRSLLWYLEEFKNDPTETVILHDGSPAVEHSFSLDIGGGIIFCGHLDRLVLLNDDHYIMDQKTSGATITTQYFKNFSPDNQMSGYSYGGMILFKTPIKGVIIDAAQIAVGFTRYTRGFVHRSIPVLEEWLDNSLRLIETARKATIEKHFPMNQTACGNYGGCEFRGVCERAPQHRNSILQANFEKKPRWDPLQRR